MTPATMNRNFITVSRCLLFFVLILLHPLATIAQPYLVKGKITDKETNVPLDAVSIVAFQKGISSGTISNTEGIFQVVIDPGTDSLQFSRIGYASKTIDLSQNTYAGTFLKIEMQVQQKQLGEVIVRNTSALEIVRKAVAATHDMIPGSDYETGNFYREIIKDSSSYYSVAEAAYKTQYYPSEKSFRMQLLKGRAKEDVASTRMFEDFHPGGGPQALAGFSFSDGFPDFLNLKKLRSFRYKKDSVIQFGDKFIYVISFDQNPDVHEALERGKLFIDTDDYAVIKYECESSPIGLPYVKNLQGTDKLMAKLLKIDFERKYWQKLAEFTVQTGKLILSHAAASYNIAYRQPKKNIDLDIIISTEMIVTAGARSFATKISKAEEWQRKNIPANMPLDFDANFWGTNNIIEPTTELKTIIEGMGIKNNEQPISSIDATWKKHNENMFIAAQNSDSIILIPVAKGAWEDGESAGIVYQEVSGDFSFEAELRASKRNNTELPDIGFQQAGIIIRDASTREENNVVLACGTGGNSKIKYFLRRTDRGKSKGPVDNIDDMNGWLKFEKKGNTISAFIKKTETDEWKKIATYQLSWLDKSLEVGFIVMAKFPGNGPKMKPDMRAIFTHYSLIK